MEALHCPQDIFMEVDNSIEDHVMDFNLADYLGVDYCNNEDRIKVSCNGVGNTDKFDKFLAGTLNEYQHKNVTESQKMSEEKSLLVANSLDQPNSEQAKSNKTETESFRVVNSLIDSLLKDTFYKIENVSSEQCPLENSVLTSSALSKAMNTDLDSVKTEESQFLLVPSLAELTKKVILKYNLENNESSLPQKQTLERNSRKHKRQKKIFRTQNECLVSNKKNEKTVKTRAVTKINKNFKGKKETLKKLRLTNKNKTVAKKTVSKLPTIRTKSRQGKSSSGKETQNLAEQSHMLAEKRSTRSTVLKQKSSVPVKKSRQNSANVKGSHLGFPERKKNLTRQSTSKNKESFVIRKELNSGLPKKKKNLKRKYLCKDEDNSAIGRELGSRLPEERKNLKRKCTIKKCLASPESSLHEVVLEAGSSEKMFLNENETIFRKRFSSARGKKRACNFNQSSQINHTCSSSRKRKMENCMVKIEKMPVIDRLLPEKNSSLDWEPNICDLCEPKRLFISKNGLAEHVNEEHISNSESEKYKITRQMKRLRS